MQGFSCVLEDGGDSDSSGHTCRGGFVAKSVVMAEWGGSGMAEL